MRVNSKRTRNIRQLVKNGNIPMGTRAKLKDCSKCTRLCTHVQDGSNKTTRIVCLNFSGWRTNHRTTHCFVSTQIIHYIFVSLRYRYSFTIVCDFLHIKKWLNYRNTYSFKSVHPRQYVFKDRIIYLVSKEYQTF